MDSLPEIDVVNSSPSELLASPLKSTIFNSRTHGNYSSRANWPYKLKISKKYSDITADNHFMESGTCPPFKKPLKRDEDQDCDLIPILSSRQFQSHLTSLYMIATKYKFIIREFKNDYHTSIASNLFTPYDWWLNNKVKFSSLQ